VLAKLKLRFKANTYNQNQIVIIFFFSFAKTLNLALPSLYVCFAHKERVLAKLKRYKLGFAFRASKLGIAKFISQV